MDPASEAVKGEILEAVKAHVEAGDFDEAARRANELTALGPGETAKFLECAYACDNAGKHEQAVFYYRQVVRADPRCPNAWTNLGLLIQRQGRYDEAIACYTTQLESTPDDPWASHNIGVIHCYRKKDFVTAIPFLERAHRIEPEDVLIHHNLAWTYYKNRDYEKAFCNYREILDLIDQYMEWIKSVYSHTSEIYADFALTCLKLNRRGTAKRAIEMAVKLRPKYRTNWGQKYRRIHERVVSGARG